MSEIGQTVDVKLNGHTRKVSSAHLALELTREGPPPRYPLLLAILQHAKAAQAIPRLTSMLHHPIAKGQESMVMQAAHGLLGLLPIPCKGETEAEQAALLALRSHADRVSGAAGATLRAGLCLLTQGPPHLIAVSAEDRLLLRQGPYALCLLRNPAPLLVDLPPLFAFWLESLSGQSKSTGVHAYRSYLGDIAEAFARVVATIPCTPSAILAEGVRSTLLDALIAELPGTADFLSARAMVWALGVLGPLLEDDAGIAAIERARDRFANEEFHADCDSILKGEMFPRNRHGQ